MSFRIGSKAQHAPALTAVSAERERASRQQGPFIVAQCLAVPRAVLPPGNVLALLPNHCRELLLARSAAHRDPGSQSQGSDRRGTP